jgi:hypothetical protein
MGADAVEGARDRGVVTGLAGWSWRGRLPVILLAAALITLIELRVGVTIAHSRHDVYRLPRVAVVTVVAAGVLATVAAAGLVIVPRPRGAIIVAVVAALLVAGIGTAFSIGLLLIPAAIVSAFAIVPALRGDGPRVWGLAFLCGVPLGVGLVAVSIVSIQPPLVKCETNSVTESERAWWGGGSGTSSGTDWMSPAGDAHGTITSDGQAFRYACRGSDLVSFSERE